nr:helix-turn-helix domain-containing protein [Marinobacter panjinensis]
MRYPAAGHARTTTRRRLCPVPFACFRRLTRARDLLRQPGHKITAIALACSFNDSSQFSRTFKD